jgi:hypothetical protein
VRPPATVLPLLLIGAVLLAAPSWAVASAHDPRPALHNPIVCATLSVRRSFARRYVIVGVLLVAGLGTALVIERPWTSCPSDWGDAARVSLGTASGDMTLDGTMYRVGGSALLDYMPRVLSTRWTA